MSRWAGIARTGASSALLHPLRSATTVACVVAILLPYVAGLAVSQGLRDEAEDSIAFGADLYVVGRRLGRNVPVPIAAADAVRAIPGVLAVTPRIVGEIHLGIDEVSAVLVGVPAARLPAGTVVEPPGRLFAADAANEFVVGSQLARRLGLVVGSKIPPFYRNDEGERVSTVVGIFRSDAAVWEANLVFASLSTAETVFAQKGLASSLLVETANGRRAEVKAAILRLSSLEAADEDARHGRLEPAVTSREDLAALLPRGILHREGIFGLHFLLAFAVGIPLVLLTTGVGLAERRRETGLLKAVGWQTDEVVVRSMSESLLLSIAGASISILLAFAWLRLLGGFGIAGVFLHGVDAAPGVEIPFRLAPVPALLAYAISFVVVMTGTIGSSWRASIAPPSEAMR